MNPVKKNDSVRSRGNIGGRDKYTLSGHIATFVSYHVSHHA